MVETILGCKWPLTVYSLLERGVSRPGAMERSVEGLTAKVLNTCLRRNVDLGILEKISFAEVPPRVEYRFTPLGMEFRKVLAAVNELQLKFEG